MGVRFGSGFIAEAFWDGIRNQLDDYLRVAGVPSGVGETSQTGGAWKSRNSPITSVGSKRGQASNGPAGSYGEPKRRVEYAEHLRNHVDKGFLCDAG